MDLRSFFDDERAVSPVIGVILMVAITVILAAVIGTFVLGLGDQVQQTTPQASFGYDSSSEDPSEMDSSIGSHKVLTVTHESGDTISESELEVSVNGDPAYGVNTAGSNNNTVELWSGSDDVSAGSSVDVEVYYTGSSTVSTTTFTWDSNGDIATVASGTGSASDWSTLSSGDTVRVVYNNPNSDKSSTLGKREVQ